MLKKCALLLARVWEKGHKIIMPKSMWLCGQLMCLIFSLVYMRPAFSFSLSQVPCNDRAKIYKVCTDQKVLFQEKAMAAMESGKFLLITFGADWCPWCQSMNTILSDQSVWSSLDADVLRLDIGVFKYDGRKKNSSGVQILKDLIVANKKKAKDYNGIPLLSVVDPKTNKAIFIKTADLEDNSQGKGHDKDKVIKAVLDSVKTLRL